MMNRKTRKVRRRWIRDRFNRKGEHIRYRMYSLPEGGVWRCILLKQTNYGDELNGKVKVPMISPITTYS